MKYSQSDIIEIAFPLPNGQFKVHPAVIISNRDVLDIEESYICLMLSTKEHNPEFIYTIQPNMLTYQSDKVSFVKCQLVATVRENQIMKRFGSLKSEYFNQLLKKLNISVYSFECK